MKVLICTIKSWNIELAEEWRKTCKHQVEIFTRAEELTLERVQAVAPEIILFPHWSYFIPKEIYEGYECVVFHMTDLPYGRGGSPLQNLIVRGHQETKLSALRVTKELDQGPIYGKEDLSLEGSAQEIFQRAAELIFHKMIPDILDNRPEPVPQEGEVVLFKRRKPKESQLTSDMTMEQIYNHIRMLDAEGYPNAYMMLGNHQLTFTQAKYQNGTITCQVEIRE